MRLINFFIVAVLLFSCRSSKTVQKASEVRNTVTDSSVTTTDSTRTITKSISQEHTIFGDTLTGSLSFTEEQVSGMEAAGEVAPAAVDSLESNGVKIKLSFIKNKAGGYKAKVQVIAKPVQVVSIKQTTVDEKKGLTTAASKQTTEKVVVKTTAKTVTGWPWYLKLVLWGGLALGISFFIYYKIKNYG